MKTNESLLLYFYRALLGFTLLMFCYVSLNNFISHSELWSITSGKLLGQMNHQAAPVYYKVIFYSLLKPFSLFKMGNVEHIQLSRLLFGFIAFACFWLTAINVFKVTASRFTTIFFMIFLLSFQVYFYNVYRVRADLVASLFLLLAMTRINRLYLRKPSALKKMDPALLAFYLLAFFSTPKAIYLILAMAIYHSFLFFDKNTLKQTIKHITFFILVPLALFLSVTALIFNSFMTVDNPYLLALSYHLQSAIAYSQHATWGNVITVIKINYFHVFLISLGVFLFIKNKNNQKERLYQGQILLFSLALIILVVHTEKWHYFLAQLIPFLSLPIIFLVKQLKKPIYILVAGSLLVASPLLTTTYNSWFVSNHQQLNAIRNLDTITKQIPGSNYFDSTGLLPQNTALMWFLGPNDPQAKAHALKMLNHVEPDFIFYTPKVSLAAPEVLVVLFNNYDEIVTDVWVKKSLSNQIDLNELTPQPPLQQLFIYDYLPYLKY